MCKLQILLISSISWSVFANEVDDLCHFPNSICELQVRFKKTDNALDNVYKLVMSNIKSAVLSDYLVEKTELQRTLVASQSAWLNFKKLNCDAFYALHSGGRQRNEARLECEIEMTNRRIQYLKEIYL